MATSDVGYGAASGAAAGGSMFGPVGAVVGGVIGGIAGLGSGRKRKRAEHAAKVANTKQSYQMTADSFSSLREGRERAAKGYAQDMATTRAKFAASGGRLEGTAWNQSSGENVRRRDELLTDIQFQEDEWRGSEAYGYVKQDFENMKKGGDSYVGASLRGDDQKVEQLIDWKTPVVKRYTGKSEEAPAGAYDRVASDPDRQGYLDRIAPTMAEYEQHRFGNAEDKAKYSTAMDQRLTSANEWYEGQKAMRWNAGAEWRAAWLRSKPMRDRNAAGGDGDGGGNQTGGPSRGPSSHGGQW